MTDTRKTIFFVGATGAQGLPVIKALLAPSANGEPSPWRIRALTRDPTHHRAITLKEWGVEIIKGSFLDFSVIEKGMEGAYGAFINTDGFSVGAQAELHAGIVIYEIAKRHKVRHFVYSSLDYVNKLTGWNPLYNVDHYNGKARVGQFLLAQPNEIDEPTGTMWTVFNTGPYTDTIEGPLAHFQILEDGTAEFTTPGGDGHLPFIALDDLAWWARHIFDSPSTTTGFEFGIASHMASWPEIVETYTRVTGKPAVYKQLTIEEHLNIVPGIDKPMNSLTSVTWRQNLTAAWNLWSGGVVKRDMEWIRSVHPGTLSLEDWMRGYYLGHSRNLILKGMEDMTISAYLADEKA